MKVPGYCRIRQVEVHRPAGRIFLETEDGRIAVATGLKWV